MKPIPAGFFAVALTLASAWAGSETQVNPREPQRDSSEARMHRVLRGLLPEGAKPETLEARMAYYHTPGASIAVINDYKIEWARGFGVLEAGKAESQAQQVTTHSLFQVASIGKPIFALAVMKLVEEGKLNLDEDVNLKLTSWKIPPSGSWQPKVTLRQILSHSAGFNLSGFPGYPKGTQIPSLLDILEGRSPATSLPIEVNSLPGTLFRYSGGGITVAQQLVADVTKESFPKMMSRLIFEPLGLNDSSFEKELSPAQLARAASGHPHRGVVLPYKYRIYPESAAGGLWTTPSDLATIGIELQKTLAGLARPDGTTSRLVSQTSIKQMITPGIDEKIGIGFMLKGKGKALRFTHTGWNIGYVTWMSFSSEGGKGAVITLNSNEGNPLLTEIERSIAQEYDWAEYPKYLPKNTPRNTEDSEKTLPLDSKGLEPFLGGYQSAGGIQLTVLREKNETLLLQLPGQNALIFKPESENRFVAEAFPAELVFQRNGGDKDAKADSLTLNQEKGSISAKRIPVRAN